ncbi:MAG TPA: hypothetical protein PKI32_08045 [Opitutales bacterium]|nr:hypothetical protein [Opitutales bacterium]
MKLNLFGSLRNRFLFAFAGILLGMVLGILILVRWLGLDPMISAMLLVLTQVICARLLPDWRERLVADSAIIGMVLSYALATGSWKTVLAAVLTAPVCAILVALLTKDAKNPPVLPKES